MIFSKCRKRIPPSSVKVTPFAERVTNVAPNFRSKVLIEWLTADWVTPKAAAALVKLPVSERASKARTRLGSGISIMMKFHSLPWR